MHKYLQSTQVPTGQKDILRYVDGAEKRLEQLTGWQLLHNLDTDKLRLSHAENRQRCEQLAADIVARSVQDTGGQNPVRALERHMFHYVGHPDKEIRRWQYPPLGFRAVARGMNAAVASVIDWRDNSLIDIARDTGAADNEPKGWFIKRRNLVTTAGFEQEIVHADTILVDELKLVTLRATPVGASRPTYHNLELYTFFIGPENYTNEVVTGELKSGRYLGVTAVAGCDIGVLSEAVKAVTTRGHSTGLRQLAGNSALRSYQPAA
ncbi:MAG: hypothetical protein WBO35_04190 [Candidatus Saccharimonadales bacterium]